MQPYYGHSSLARITAVIFSWDSRGESPPALAGATLQNQWVTILITRLFHLVRNQRQTNSKQTHNLKILRKKSLKTKILYYTETCFLVFHYFPYCIWQNQAQFLEIFRVLYTSELWEDIAENAWPLKLNFFKVQLGQFCVDSGFPPPTKSYSFLSLRTRKSSLLQSSMHLNYYLLFIDTI